MQGLNAGANHEGGRTGGHRKGKDEIYVMGQVKLRRCDISDNGSQVSIEGEGGFGKG